MAPAPQLEVRGWTITTAIAWAVHEGSLAFGDVVVREYLTFMEVMRQG